MRVAISGTHSCGKSTLIDAFLLRHPDYVHEPEAYEALQHVYGEAFAEEPSADDFYSQLEYHVGRLRRYRLGDRVIFERSPSTNPQISLAPLPRLAKPIATLTTSDPKHLRAYFDLTIPAPV